MQLCWWAKGSRLSPILKRPGGKNCSVLMASVMVWELVICMQPVHSGKSSLALFLWPQAKCKPAGKFQFLQSFLTSVIMLPGWEHLVEGRYIYISLFPRSCKIWLKSCDSFGKVDQSRARWPYESDFSVTEKCAGAKELYSYLNRRIYTAVEERNGVSSNWKTYLGSGFYH